jgi:hypothetical protein
MKIFCLDKAQVNGDWKEFPDGRLIVPVTLTRTGVFKYLYSDIFGKTENKDYPKSMFKDGIISVYRSFEEVNKSIESMKGMFFTDEHPSQTVTTENQKLLSKGSVSTVINIREEKYNTHSIHYFDSEIVITDEPVKNYLKNKIKEQVSLGYTAGFRFESGTFAGMTYDAIQTDIENNHTALTKKGRAGEKVKIKSKIGDTEMVTSIEDKEIFTKETFIMDLRGIKINFSDSNSEVLIEQEIKDKDKFITTLETKVKAFDSLEAKALKLEKDLKDAQSVDLEALADERLNIISKAKNYVKDTDFKGKSNFEVMKSAVSSHYQGKDLKDKSEGFFKDSFELLDDSPNQNTKDNKPSVRDSVKPDSIKTEVSDLDSLAEILSNAYNPKKGDK